MNWDLIISIVIGVTAKWIIILILRLIVAILEHRENKEFWDVWSKGKR